MDPIKYNDKKPIGQSAVPLTRSPADVEATRKELTRAEILTALPWIVVCAVAASTFAVLGERTLTFPFTFMAAFLAVQAYASYCVSQACNEETLGTPYTETSKGPAPTDDPLTQAIRAVCSRNGVSPPSRVEYGDDTFLCEYDPNEKALTLGRYLGDFKTGASFASALHETCHHVLLSAPSTGKIVFAKLRAAAVGQTLAVVSCVLCALCAAFGDASGARWSLTAFACSFLTAKALITTHEYETNDMACGILKSGEIEELKAIEDPQAAMRMLKAGERTYTVDFLGWAGLSVMIFLLMPTL